jgi:hypothetical protein
VRLRPPPQTEPRFIADVHLGRLTAYLRLAGFDTKYRNDCPGPYAPPLTRVLRPTQRLRDRRVNVSAGGRGCDLERSTSRQRTRGA